MTGSVGLPSRIVLIGFMATGKSAVGHALAARLGWTFLDTDDLIEQATGRTVPDVFAHDGEPAFRALERDAAREAAAQDNAVIATGGGLWLDPANRALLSDGGFIVTLEARWDTILARHAGAESARPDARPLLAGPLSMSSDPIDTVRRLKAARQPIYALADATVHTDNTPVDAVADQIVTLVQRDGARAIASDARRHAMIEGPLPPLPPEPKQPQETPAATSGLPDFGPDVAAVVRTGGPGQETACPVYCGWDLLARLPGILDRVAGGPGRVFLVSDTAVQPLYGDSLIAALRDPASPRTPPEVHAITIPPGETSKNLDQLGRLYDWLSAARAERGDIVLALGGGVVTDIAGTAAATYLRGMPLVHVPTTLLGMVDAAIGGKVAIDLPAGKNLVGAFYQPRAVIADIATLATLPARELRAGFGEVIKHAFIADPVMLDELERDADLLLSLNAPGALDHSPTSRDLAVSLIGRNMAIKARAVSADERESGIRTTLNYGHTIAHALEAVTAYGTYLHGEAVAIGLIGAARIAHGVELIDAATLARHEAVIDRFGLPSRAASHPGLTADAVLMAMRSDKKVAAGRQRWVLLESIGSPVVRDDIPAALVEEVVRDLVEPDPAP